MGPYAAAVAAGGGGGSTPPTGRKGMLQGTRKAKSRLCEVVRSSACRMRYFA